MTRGGAGWSAVDAVTTEVVLMQFVYVLSSCLECFDVSCETAMSNVSHTHLRYSVSDLIFVHIIPTRSSATTDGRHCMLCLVGDVAQWLAAFVASTKLTHVGPG